MPLTCVPSERTVEAVRVSLVPRRQRHNGPQHGDGEYLIVRHHGTVMTWARTVADVEAAGCDLASLAETG